jgi:hypothetical protein
MFHEKRLPVFSSLFLGVLGALGGSESFLVFGQYKIRDLSHTKNQPRRRVGVERPAGRRRYTVSRDITGFKQLHDLKGAIIPADRLFSSERGVTPTRIEQGCNSAQTNRGSV